MLYLPTQTGPKAAGNVPFVRAGRCDLDLTAGLRLAGCPSITSLTTFLLIRAFLELSWLPPCPFGFATVPTAAKTSRRLTKPSLLQTSTWAGTWDPGLRRPPGAPQDCLLPALWPTQVRLEGSRAQHSGPQAALGCQSPVSPLARRSSVCRVPACSERWKLFKVRGEHAQGSSNHLRYQGHYAGWAAVNTQPRHILMRRVREGLNRLGLRRGLSDRPVGTALHGEGGEGEAPRHPVTR